MYRVKEYINRNSVGILGKGLTKETSVGRD